MPKGRHLRDTTHLPPLHRTHYKNNPEINMDIAELAGDFGPTQHLAQQGFMPMWEDAALERRLER